MKLHKKVPIPDLSGNIVFDMLIIAVILYLAYLVLDLLGKGATTIGSAVSDSVKYVVNQGSNAIHWVTGVDTQPHGVLTPITDLQSWVPSSAPDGTLNNDDAGNYDPLPDVVRMQEELDGKLVPPSSDKLRNIILGLNGWQFAELYTAFGIQKWKNIGLGLFTPSETEGDNYTLTDLLIRSGDASFIPFFNAYIISYVTDGKGTIAGM